jgi:hypothetical protein
MQTSEAVKYSQGSFQPVIDKCEGCDRIVDENAVNYCKTYADPASKWRIGICNFATHSKPEINIIKVRVNPLKASKRANRRKK